MRGDGGHPAVIRLDIDHLPSGATTKPVWLWWSGTDARATDIDRLWQTYLRRFDTELPTPRGAHTPQDTADETVNEGQPPRNSAAQIDDQVSTSYCRSGSSIRGE